MKRHLINTALLLASLCSFDAHAGGPPFGFFGAGGGLIPDNDPFGGVTTTFNVTGVTGQVASVNVKLNISHTFVGDLTATLFAPNNIAALKLFGRVGSSRIIATGDNSNLGGTYEFRDSAALDFWVSVAQVDSNGIVTTGAFRTTTAGTGDVAAPQRSNVGGCSTFLQLAFGGLRASQANGQWRLVVTDSAAQDTGTVTANGTFLEIDTVPELPEAPLFRSSFEDVEAPSTPNAIPPITASNVLGSCTPGINSPTASGLTDFIMVRAVPGSSDVEWRIKKNDFSNSGVEFAPFVFGKNIDSFVMADFDGDGASDAAVWSPNTARFMVRRSSRPNDAPMELILGTAGDVPKVIADFDGDRVSDFAVYRDGTPADTTAHFFVRKSSSSVVSDFLIPNSDNGIPFSMRDINNDARADFGVQFNAGANVGGIRMFSGVTGGALSIFNFGLSTDLLFPGQFVGDAVTDIAVSRNANPGSGTVKYGFPRDMATGAGDATTLATGIAFGVPNDRISQGDYDGDGLVDFAIWRPSPAAGQSKFVIRRSSLPATPLEVFFGATGDYPVNNWDVH